MEVAMTNQVLSWWAEACNNAGVEWYLYKETLLCANGYHKFTDELKLPQVVVPGRELPKIVAQVLPNLPEGWEIPALHGHTFHIYQAGKILLEAYVLYGIEDRELVKESGRELRAIRRQSRKQYNKLRTMKKLLGSLFEKQRLAARATLEEETAAALADYFTQREETAQLYCDYSKKKTGAVLDKAWFSGETVMLPCEDTAFPAFPGYREYLEETYGDYENGLFDEIGCGLTVEDKEALKAHQQRCKEALAFIQQLSQEFGLRYYLLAGSVLGPVRHGGFIPWDDDIDIGIRIEELEEFEALVEEYLPQRLPEGFSLKKPGVGKSEYPRMFSKICYDGRCCMDLWPLVPTYAEGFRAKLVWGIGKVITKVHYKKIGYKVTRYKKIVKLVDPFLSDKLVMRIARRNERRYANRPTDAYINLYSIYRRRKETILRTWLDTPATLDFDGMQVPVVGCTEEYLTHLYGNYMWKPAPWSRASRHVERF